MTIRSARVLVLTILALVIAGAMSCSLLLSAHVAHAHSSLRIGRGSGGTVDLGGVDFDGYCFSLGYQSVVLSGNSSSGLSCVDAQGNLFPIDVTAACIWQNPDATGVSAQVGASNPFNLQCYGQLALLGTPVHQVAITVAPKTFAVGTVTQIVVTGVGFQNGEEVVVSYLAQRTDGPSVTEVDGTRANGGGGITAVLPVPTDLVGIHYTITATGTSSGNSTTTGLTAIGAPTLAPTITPTSTVQTAPPPASVPATASVPASTFTSTPTETPTALPTNTPTALPAVTPTFSGTLSFNFDRLRIVNAQGQSQRHVRIGSKLFSLATYTLRNAPGYLRAHVTLAYRFGSVDQGKTRWVPGTNPIGFSERLSEGQNLLRLPFTLKRIAGTAYSKVRISVTLRIRGLVETRSETITIEA